MAAALRPDPDRSVLAVAAPGKGPGYWAGAPSAVECGGEIYLAYRLRRPLEQGRGYAVAVAHSRDGTRFETLAMIGKEEMGAESLERPALLRTPGGKWRLYLSCATYGSKHWRVEVIEASDPGAFDARQSQVTLPGDAKTGVKDPVIVYRGGLWHMWVACHPLKDPAETDQMVSDYATSVDGLRWTWHATALSGRAGQWDARGARIASACFAGNSMIVAYYDGRASAAENYEERTGVASGIEPSALTALGSEPIAQAAHGGCLRYLDVVPLRNGDYRLYYEISDGLGGHELRTELRSASLAGHWSGGG